MTSSRTKRFPRLAALVAAGLAALALVACGGPSEEEETQAIEEVAIGYGASDGAEACEFLSASALDQVGGASGCTEQFQNVPPAEFEVEEVTLDEDDTATATVRNLAPEGQVIELGFVKEDDAWKISSFPGIETIQPPTEAPEELAPPAEPEDGTTETEPEPGETEPTEPEETEPPADEPEGETTEGS